MRTHGCPATIERRWVDDGDIKVVLISADNIESGVGEDDSRICSC
jgi:hypothetical protein